MYYNRVREKSKFSGNMPKESPRKPKISLVLKCLQLRNRKHAEIMY